MRNIILYKYNFLQKFLFWSKKYAISRHVRTNNHNVVIVDNDILGASEYRLADYEAALVENEIFNELIDKSSIEYLSEWGGKEYSKKLIGKRILYETKSIYISIGYVHFITIANIISAHLSP